MYMGKRIFISLFLIFFMGSAVNAYDGPKWDMMPLTVYLPKGPQSAVITNAFKTWQNKSKGMVRFVYRSTPNLASMSNISVRYINTLEDGSQYKVNNKFSNFPYKNYTNHYYRNEIVIATTDSSGKPLSNSAIYSAALSAVGEAVGIKYSDNSANNLKQSLSDDDIKSLNSIYKRGYQK